MSKIDSWAVDLAEVGAVYPFQGSEKLMVIVAVVVWLGRGLTRFYKPDYRKTVSAGGWVNLHFRGNAGPPPMPITSWQGGSSEKAVLTKVRAHRARCALPRQYGTDFAALITTVSCQQDSQRFE